MPVLLRSSEEFSTLTLFKDSQSENAQLPILVTLSGIVTFVNPPGTATSVFPSFVNKRTEIDLKEGLPESTEKDMRLVQSTKAPSPILVTLFGIDKFVKEEQLAKVASPMLVTLFGIVMLVKEEQPAKAKSPMLVTLFEIVMLVKEEQPRKTPSPILVTLSGIVMLVKDSQ